MALTILQAEQIFAFIDQSMQNTVLLNNSKNIWPIKIPMPFVSSSDNLLRDAYIIFQKVLIILKHALMWFGVPFSLNLLGYSM